MVTDLAAGAVESVPGLGAGDVGGVAKTRWRTRLPLGVVRIDATAVAVHRPVHLPDAGSSVGAYSPYKAQAVVLIAQTETGRVCLRERLAGGWVIRQAARVAAALIVRREAVIERADT
jgi:hypothetical protein